MADSTTIPETVQGDVPRALYGLCNDLRRVLKNDAEAVNKLRQAARPGPGIDPEVISNVTLAYRHLEDASMRLGKAMQALDGGVSVYDRATTVGA